MALLTVETVPAFVKEKLSGIADAPVNVSSQLTAKEIHGGNLNYTFQVTDDAGGSVFVKQAPDFIKVLGPEAKLARERIKLERKVYQEWEAELGPTTSAKYFPKIFAFDEDRMAFVMEFLGSCRLLQEILFEGVVDKSIAQGLGEAMGLMHAKTHCSVLPAIEAQRLTAAYENAALRGVQLEYVFSKCFREDERAAHLRIDAAFMAELEALKAAYRGEHKDDLSLCHGDLHAGSVMVDAASGLAKIIDPEFAIYGPPGLDVGSLVSTYAMAYCYHVVLKNLCQDDFLVAIESVWAAYATTLTANGISHNVVAKVAELVVGFAGCEIARTALGLAYERSLRIPDEGLKKEAEIGALEVGVLCIRGRHGKGIEVLIEVLKGFSGKYSSSTGCAVP